MKNLFIMTILTFMLLGCKDETNAPSSVTPFELWQSQNLHNYTVE